jgi:hypothetical protein
VAEDDVKYFWVTDSLGEPRAFHTSCGRWLGLEPEIIDRQPFHTEICRGCGRFLDAPPPDKSNSPPMDGKLVL